MYPVLAVSERETTRDDVRSAVAEPNGHHGLCSIDSKHWKDVDERVYAPADHGHELGGLDLAPDHWGWPALDPEP